MDLINAVVIHKAFGEGVVVSVDGDRITAKFKAGEKTLKYPWAFEQGFMKFQNEDLQKEMDALILDQQAEEKKKLAEEEEKKKQEAEEKKKKLEEITGASADIPVNGEMKYTRRKLLEEIKAGKTFTYHPFYGHRVTKVVTHNCFSNWYPCTFMVNGITYTTSEQYMMSQKALLFGDHVIYQEIMNTSDPRKCKDLGQKVRNFDTAVWNQHNYGIVLEGCKAKFSQNPEFAEVLLATGDEIIIEASPSDHIWGVALKDTNDEIRDPSKWRGTNYLGFVLMEVRDYLRENN